MDMKIRDNNVLIIDAMNLIHRSFYAYPRLTTKDGVPTGAFFGFVKYLKSFQEKFNPKHIIVCSDAHRKSFRNEIYPEYKGNRNETDIDLKNQFSFMEKYLELCGIKFIKMDNFEADDLIGTLAKRAIQYGYVPYIISGDRDLFQLIDENIHQVYLSTKGMEIYDIAKLAERYEGLRPEQIIELKALSGDTSDNIPGVKGIGEKTAIKLLQEFGSLDGIYENIDKQKGKKKENLENDKEMAYISKQLVTINCNVDIDFDNLFERQNPLTLCTTEAYEYLRSLDIHAVFTKAEIVDIPKKSAKVGVPKEGLELPFEIVEDGNGDIYFRSLSKYCGDVSKEGMEIYLYSMIFDKKNREKLKEMITSAKENLIIESEKNEAEIAKIEETEKELFELLFNNK